MKQKNLTVESLTKYCLVAGKSEGYSTLNAFDGALLDAGVGNVNLVRMSSILPPNFIRVDRFTLPYGALVPLAYASKCSTTKNEEISSGVAIALPVDPNLPGVIMEYSAADPQNIVEEQVRKMAEEAMKMRNWELKQVESIAISHCIQSTGATFAGVVLWD